MREGLIFDLKRFAVHDGDGLRTTLFLKGCPLRCPWCQNPEGLEQKPLVWYAPTECLRCGTCVKACPQGALSLSPQAEAFGGSRILPEAGMPGGTGISKGAAAQGESCMPEGIRLHMDRNRCTLCGACEQACPAAALQVKGERISSRAAADRLLRDRVFFGERGGVTLSGGECLMQWEFAREVLELCKGAGVDTAIESCLLAPSEAVKAMCAVTDHFIIDIKYMDGDTHRSVTGADNRLILQNYEYLTGQGADVLVRTPLIPGYTASEENIRAIARYVKRTNPEAKYELLNFNPLCRSKYEALEIPYPVEENAPLSGKEMERFYRILEEEGIRNVVRE